MGHQMGVAFEWLLEKLQKPDGIAVGEGGPQDVPTIGLRHAGISKEARIHSRSFMLAHGLQLRRLNQLSRLRLCLWGLLRRACRLPSSTPLGRRQRSRLKLGVGRWGVSLQPSTTRPKRPVVCVYFGVGTHTELAVAVAGPPPPSHTLTLWLRGLTDVWLKGRPKSLFYEFENSSRELWPRISCCVFIYHVHNARARNAVHGFVGIGIVGEKCRHDAL